MPTLYDYEVIKKEKELFEYNYNEKLDELNRTKNKLEQLLKELLDRKVLSSWQYNGEYSYEYSKDYSTVCDYQDEAKRLEKELEKERKINEYIKARFVLCNTCTDEERKKCLMFTEGLCEGERCEQIVDLEALLDKAADEGVVR